MRCGASPLKYPVGFSSHHKITLPQRQHRRPLATDTMRASLIIYIRSAFLLAVASAFHHPSSHSRSNIITTTVRRDLHIMNAATSSKNGPFPELVVFDLDACFWDQEMYTLSNIPDESDVIRGDLHGRGDGVVGVMSGRTRISLHGGSLSALQSHLDGRYPGTRVCFASSADTELAERIGRSALRLLEVVPGTSVWDLVVERDWGGVDVNQIGRRPPLSANKSATHFPLLRELTRVRYDRMLFFDGENEYIFFSLRVALLLFANVWF